jgi:putative DNA primase/helicase
LDAKGEPVKEHVRLERPEVFFATVFNAEQIDGLPPIQRKTQDWNAVERAEQILTASGVVIRHGEQNRAFYRPTTDSIHLPGKSQFATADNYYGPLPSWDTRQATVQQPRPGAPFGSEGYAKEELRAGSPA